MHIPEKITDAHHHLWDLAHCHYPWLMERGVKRFFGDPAPIQRDYLVADLCADFAELPVTKSVHVQVGVALEDSLKETRWLQKCNDESGLPSAIVGFADLRDSALRDVLTEQSQSAGLRGIRQIVGRSAEEDAKTGTNELLGDPAFLEGLRELAHQNLSFDLQLTPPLMRDVANVLARAEGLQVALCHGGSPSDFSAEGMENWRQGLRTLAEVPGMICKLSGFGMFNQNWDLSHIRPLILTAIDVFGTERIAFGSNFPVDKLYASYDSTMRAYLEVVQDFTRSEIDAMFAGNADAFYRI